MKKFYLVLLSVLMFSLLGCSEKTEDTNETSVVISKKGEITNIIVESFLEDYYTEDGLKTFFTEKIREYDSNPADEIGISLDSLVVADGIAKATLHFSNYKAYSEFYNTDFFYGTVNEAYDSGYIMDTTLKAPRSSETISKADLMKNADRTIIILSEPILVSAPKKIIYASANVEIIDEKHVRISSDSTGLAYILME